MASQVSRRDAENQIIRLCQSSADGADLRAGVLRGLRRIMSIDAVFFATADPETLLITGGWAEQPLDTVAQVLLDNEFRQDDVNKFATLAMSAHPVASLDSTTRGERTTSARYNEIMRPVGLGDELRAALTVGDECWGYVCLHREDGPLGFTSDEAATLQRLAPHIAIALRREAVLTNAAANLDQLGPGVVVLADDLSVIAMTPQAEQLLSLIEPYGASGLPLPVAIYSVAIALSAVERGVSSPKTMPMTRVASKVGPPMRLSASRLQSADGVDQVAVVVELDVSGPSIPRILSAHGLTTREAEVATHVLRGSSTDAISAELHISRYTVQDHLKSVFDKVGVRSRRELIGRLLAPQR
jgi:DNA-binding CsgD family transcriptional regulator